MNQSERGRGGARAAATKATTPTPTGGDSGACCALQAWQGTCAEGAVDA